MSLGTPERYVASQEHRQLRYAASQVPHPKRDISRANYALSAKCPIGQCHAPRLLVSCCMLPTTQVAACGQCTEQHISCAVANQHGYRLSFARVSHHAHNFHCSGRGECKCNGCLVPKPIVGQYAPSVRHICPSAASNARILNFYAAPHDRSTCTYARLASVDIRQLVPAITGDMPV